MSAVLTDVEPARNGDTAERAGAGTTWAAIPLGDVLSGAYTEPPPAMLARLDGHCLLYPARAHALHAEPEALKTWLALKACAERILAFESALYIDFEDSPASVAGRLVSLGLDSDQIAGGFVYIRPDEPFTDAARYDLDAAIATNPSLAVIDGVTEAFSRQGLNPLDNSDVAAWLDLIPRRLTRAGVAVLLLDHVVKDRENRGRYAIGAQHKLAGVDVAYSMRVLEPFARGRDGLVAIKVEKDRPGRVREFAVDGQVALLRARSLPDGGVSIKLEPPERRDSAAFRPTVLMERVSRAVEENAGLSKRAIREAVHGQTATKDLALELLISEGFVGVQRDGQANHHHSLSPYREDTDPADRDSVTQLCLNRDSVTGEEDRDSVTPPIRGTGTGHGPNGTPTDRDRDSEHELERLRAKFPDASEDIPF